MNLPVVSPDRGPTGRRDLVTRVVLGLDAVAFLIFAAWALVDPVGLMTTADLAGSGPGAATEIRAMYGGLELGIASGLAVAAITRHRPALLLGALAFAGFAFGRGMGMVIEGPHGLHPVLVGVESCAALGNAIAWWWTGRAVHGTS